MLESCQVQVTGDVHFVLLKRSQCPLLLSVARKAAGATGRLGEVWLAQSCNRRNPRAAETFRRTLEFADNTLMFYFFCLQHSVLSVSPVHGVWLWHRQGITAVVVPIHCAQAGALCSFTTFRIQAAVRAEWGFPLAASASSSASCLQREWSSSSCFSMIYCWIF